MFGVSNSHTHNLCERVDLAFALVGHGDLHGAGGDRGSGRGIQDTGRREASQEKDNDGSEHFLHKTVSFRQLIETTSAGKTFVPDGRAAELGRRAADRSGRRTDRLESARHRAPWSARPRSSAKSA